MAKRYARINWANAPSTATPRNAANLNTMDKGIDDLDNTIEVINENLGNYKKISKSIVGTAGGTVQFSVLSGGVYLIIGDNSSQSAMHLVSEFSSIAYPSAIKANTSAITISASGATVTITATSAFTRVLIIRLD